MASIYFDQLAQIIARCCRRSPVLDRILRNLNFRGKQRVVSLMLPAFPHSQVTADCLGVRFALDLCDDVQRPIYYNCYDRGEQAVLSKTIGRKQGAICLDIGANVGFYALRFGKLVRRAGHVYAFEPDPRCYERLRFNIELNHMEDVVSACPYAISDRDERVRFFRAPPDHSGWSGLIHYRDIHVDSIIVVEAIKLDTFLSQNCIQEVEFAKIDVEGAEFAVLEGARNALSQRLFRYILIEFNGPRLAEQGKTLDDMQRTLARNGYRISPAHSGRLHPIPRDLISSRDIVINLLFERA
jgi:FkbM family methyltransferase